MLMRGFMRSVWLLNPTTPSAGAGAAAQVPTQCLVPAIDPSLKSPVGGNRAAAIGVGVMILTRRYTERAGPPGRDDSLRLGCAVIPRFFQSGRTGVDLAVEPLIIQPDRM